MRIISNITCWDPNPGHHRRPSSIPSKCQAMGIRWNRKFKAFQRKSHARRLSADVPTRSQARGNWLRRRAKPVEHQVLVSLYKPSSAKADVRESCLVTLLFFHFYFVLQWGTTIKWKTPRCNFRWSLYFFRKIFTVHWCSANIVSKNIASNRRTEAEKHVFWNTSGDQRRVAQLLHVLFRRECAKNSHCRQYVSLVSAFSL